VEVPISLLGENTVSVELLPDLAVPCIVEVDFLTKFGVVLDFDAAEWYFARRPQDRHRFSSERDSRVCCGLSELTPDQEKFLKNFLRMISTPPENPGTTSLWNTRLTWDHIQ